MQDNVIRITQPGRQFRTRDADVASILDDLRRIVRSLQAPARPSARAIAVRAEPLFALKLLAQGSALTLQELAERTRTQPSAAAELLERLRGARLVSHVRVEPAGAIQFTITAKGRALLAKTPVVPQQRLIEGLEELFRTDRKALAAALHRLVVAMQLANQPAATFFEAQFARSIRGSPRSHVTVRNTES